VRAARPGGDCVCVPHSAFQPSPPHRRVVRSVCRSAQPLGSAALGSRQQGRATERVAGGGLAGRAGLGGGAEGRGGQGPGLPRSRGPWRAARSQRGPLTAGPRAMQAACSPPAPLHALPPSQPHPRARPKQRGCQGAVAQVSRQVQAGGRGGRELAVGQPRAHAACWLRLPPFPPFPPHAVAPSPSRASSSAASPWEAAPPAWPRWPPGLRACAPPSAAPPSSAPTT
jgi:hypothetical protein